jgi:preprotein translocase subunit SecG
MLYGLLVTGYVIVCILLILLILLQKGKGSSGFGGMASSTQMIFGGSGGQDVFQKATWFLGFLFMLGSLSLSMIKTKKSQSLRYASSIERALPADMAADMADTASEQTPAQE